MHGLCNRSGRACHRSTGRMHCLQPCCGDGSVSRKLQDLERQVRAGKYLDSISGTLHRSAGRPSRTTTDLPPGVIQNSNSENRYGNVHGVFQYVTSHGGVLHCRHKSNNGKHHLDRTSGAVLQTPIHQGIIHLASIEPLYEAK